MDCETGIEILVLAGGSEELLAERRCPGRVRLSGRYEESFFACFSLWCIMVRALCWGRGIMGQVCVVAEILGKCESKEIKPVNPKGNQPWIFIGRTDAEAEAPILWPPDVKNWLTGKEADAGKRLRARGEGDSRGWDSITNSMDLSLSKLGDSEGWGSPACCSSWGCKESDMILQLNS